jgi:hypothetical protein
MSTIIVLVILGLVIFIPLIVIIWTLRGEAARYLPPRGRKRRPRVE